MPHSPSGLNLTSDRDDAECLLRVRDLAARWSVHPVTVRKWIASDVLPVVHLGPGPKPPVRIRLSVAMNFEVDQLRTDERSG